MVMMIVKKCFKQAMAGNPLKASSSYMDIWQQEIKLDKYQYKIHLWQI